MTGAIWRSAFVAALFALHPLHVESVVWITERKDVLSTMFWLATIYLYAIYARKSDNRMYFLSLTVFTLGLMAKPMLVTLPVILLFLDHWRLGRLEPPVHAGVMGDIKALLHKRLLMEKLPFLVLSVGMSIVTIWAQRQTVADITSLPLSMRMANAAWALILYAVNDLSGPSGRVLSVCCGTCLEGPDCRCPFNSHAAPGCPEKTPFAISPSWIELVSG